MYPTKKSEYQLRYYEFYLDNELSVIPLEQNYCILLHF